jgi:DNA-binding NarL/FixJ family response regulator
MATIRVLVADDHPLITQGLANELVLFDIEVHAVADGHEVIPRYLATKPDVLVLDLRMGAVRGLDVAKDLLRLDSDARVVVYSQFDQDHVVREAYRLGAKAFIPKSADPKVLADAIHAVRAGETHFLPHIAESIALMSVKGVDSPQAKLTERELAVFTKLAQGLTNAEIAVEMDLSVKTIGHIGQSIRESLGVSRPADITRLALRHQLIDE